MLATSDGRDVSAQPDATSTNVRCAKPSLALAALGSRWSRSVSIAVVAVVAAARLRCRPHLAASAALPRPAWMPPTWQVALDMPSGPSRAHEWQHKQAGRVGSVVGSRACQAPHHTSGPANGKLQYESTLRRSRANQLSAVCSNENYHPVCEQREGANHCDSHRIRCKAAAQPLPSASTMGRAPQSGKQNGSSLDLRGAAA